MSSEMGRPYGVKGKKRKKNREVYDKEEEVHEEENEVGVDDEEENVAKRSKAEEDEDEAKAQQVVDELSGIPIGPLDQDDKKNGVIFILERASLEVAKVGKVSICCINTISEAFENRLIDESVSSFIAFE